jgi:hypothetical protein
MPCLCLYCCSDVGEANPIAGQSCAPCAKGSANSEEGQLKCTLRTPGFYSNVTGLAECTACDDGSFQVGSAGRGFICLHTRGPASC